MVAGEKLLITSTCFVEHNKDQSLAKDLDIFSSDSVFLSEPPDIRNWFSSYVYESPMLGTSSLFEEFVTSKENECDEKNLILQEKDGHEVLRDNVDTGESLRHNSLSDTSTRVNQLSSKDDGSVEMKEGIPFASTFGHLEKVPQPFTQDRMSKHDVNPAKGETLSLSHRSGGCKGDHALMSMDKNCKRPPDTLQKTDMKEAISKAMIQHENSGSSATTSANVFSEWKSTRLREKENGDMGSMNGFMTTRKSRDGGAKDENCWKKTREKSSQDSTNRGRDSTACKKEGDMKRKALAEVTNIEICNNMEITGKWKCPRKGKSNIGPALKQLRLERWVHRN
ncbi:uncharacterized protein LOC129323096 isoform X2 [Prosopis cineraria]|nr:uncharacterized protein LOC129323096 isoform X2 [Prosopis cineraria]